MITIKVYKNGYEINGHAKDSICSQVSLWHWATSNLITGLDDSAKRYSTLTDNKDNPHEGYSWLTFNNTNDKIVWIFEDLVISIERWIMEFYKDQVTFKVIDNSLIKL